MRASGPAAKTAVPKRGAVVVTGASTGIGEACARRLSRTGFRVFAGVRGDADGARLETPGDGRIRALKLDVTDGTSILAVTQAFRPLVRESAGRIVNMGSISGPPAAPFPGPYAASKFALEALTGSLRIELQPWGVRVAIVEPGSISTPTRERGITAADTLEAELPEEALRLYGGLSGL